MSDQGWEHIILALLGAIPATVAALSSLKNGRTMKKNGGYVLPSAKRGGNHESKSWPGKHL